MPRRDHVPAAHRERVKNADAERSRGAIGYSYTTKEPEDDDRRNAQIQTPRHRNVRAKAADPDTAHDQALEDQDHFLIAAVESLEALRAAQIACRNVTTHGVTTQEDRLIRRVCAAAGEMIASLTAMLGDCVISAVEVRPPPANTDLRSSPC